MPDVFMPRLSDTMTEGAIARWIKAEGDQVHRGDVLAEVETDKAVMDLEAFEDGILERVLVPAGQTVPIGARVALIGDGSGATASLGETSASGPTPPPAGGTLAPASNPAAPDGDDTVTAKASKPAPEHEPTTGRPKASPVVRALSRTHGIDLSTVTGTGPGGRIIRVDIERLLADAGSTSPGTATPGETVTAPLAVTPPAPAAVRTPAPPTTTAENRSSAVPAADDEVVPLSTIRRVTARRLTEAAAVPQFSLTTVLDARRLVGFRTEINERLAPTGTKVSVTDLLVRACAVALRAHPEVNSSFGGDSIVRHRRVHVGIAVALEDGLIVPVIHDADRKSVSEIGSEARELAARARAGKLTPDGFTGGTFTISNLGMYGIDNFTALLNPPEAAILAVGAVSDQAFVRDGQVTIHPSLNLTLTVDHRVLDGASAAAFLRDLTGLLREPLRIVV
ncbi:MAG: dihydrolipoamide acetyltransferase family protein [Nakamurella sp.]